MRKRDAKITYQFENECDNKIMVLNIQHLDRRDLRYISILHS